MMHDRDISDLLDAAEALTRFAQAASHPKVDRHAAQRVHEHLVDAFNAAMHAVLKPKPVPVDDVPPEPAYAHEFGPATDVIDETKPSS